MFSFSLINKKNLASISIIATCLLLPACITTSAKSFTDPEFISYKPKKIIIRSAAQDMDFNTMIENQVIEDISRTGIDALSFAEIFIPTRSYTSNQIFSKLKELNITSLLVISPKNDTSQSNVALIQNYGTSTATANAYSTSSGNIYASAYGTSNSTSIPIRSVKREYLSESKLYDTETKKVAWLIQTKTIAQGALYVDNESLVSDISNEIVSNLIIKNHLGPYIKKRKEPVEEEDY